MTLIAIALDHVASTTLELQIAPDEAPRLPKTFLRINRKARSLMTLYRNAVW